MTIPIWSMVTLGTEIVITACVFTIIWHAYRTGRFMSVFAFCVLGYELFFNVSYMASREVAGASAAPIDPYVTALAIFHGTFSLVMFAALIAFFGFAWHRYRRGENFFRTYKKLTIVFVSAWTVSILSGIALFADLYFF